LVADRQWGAALASFDAAYRLRPNVEVALLGVKALVLSGHPETAKRYLDMAHAANVGGNWFPRQSYQKDIEDWEKMLSELQHDR
jgi:cytochrome c-type biogenesis protein CcmH/NrfG